MEKRYLRKHSSLEKILLYALRNEVNLKAVRNTDAKINVVR